PALSLYAMRDYFTSPRFLRALTSQPDSATRRIAEGRFALIQDDLSRAKSSFEAALHLETDSPEAMHWLAVAEHESGDEASARDLVGQILKAHARFLPALTDEMQFAADRKDFRVALIAQLNRMVVMPDPPASEYC